MWFLRFLTDVSIIVVIIENFFGVCLTFITLCISVFAELIVLKIFIAVLRGNHGLIDNEVLFSITSSIVVECNT